MGTMKCDVHAFFSQKLYDMSEENMWLQAHNSASYEGVTSVYIMPDAHTGYGIPIGGVVVTDDVIIQSGSGYDISCGIVMLKVPGLHASDIASWDKRDSWVREVKKRVGLGVGSGRPGLMPSFKTAQLNEILRYGAKALGIKSDVCERQYIPVEHEVDEVERAYSKALGQLGSVGGGNHFIEMQVDQDDGSVWVMVHCGSRGYGWQTANHFFYEGAIANNIPKNQRESSWLRADSELGKQYWAAHNKAANYAIANRHIIVQGVQDAIRRIFKVDSEVFYEISHNLVQQETIVLPDGSHKKGFVHRKGSTRAFPAGHPDLVGTRWEKTGHPMLIPGSMFTGGAILYAKEGAYKSGCSVNHGSGRSKPRKKAEKELKPKQQWIDDTMNKTKRKLGGVEVRGVVGNASKTPLDECHLVYKDLDDVLSVLEAENIAKVQHRLWPVAYLKGDVKGPKE